MLEGAVEHQDSMGNKEQVPAGEFQIMRPGTGVRPVSYTHLWGEQKLVVRLPHQQRPSAGSRLWLHLPEGHLHLFDGETGQRIDLA